MGQKKRIAGKKNRWKKKQNRRSPRHIDHIQQLNLSQEQTDNSHRVTADSDTTTEAFNAIGPQTDTAEQNVTGISASLTTKTATIPPPSHYPK